MKLKSVLILFMVCASLAAQDNDSIRQAILNQRDPGVEILSKGRAMVANQLASGNLSAMNETINFLAYEMGNPYGAFLPREYWLLLYWVEDYAAILDETSAFAEDAKMTGERFYLPGQSQFGTSSMLSMIADGDGLFQKVLDKSAESMESINLCIDAADINDEERDYLKVLFKSLLTNAAYDETSTIWRDVVNAEATAFLDTYPDSNYETYTRRFIRHIYGVSDWGMGFELYGGYASTGGRLGESFKSGPTFGVAWSIIYKDVDTAFRINVVGSDTKRDIPANNLTWPANESGNIMSVDMAVHYPIVNQRKVRLMPFAGIGFMGIIPTEYTIDQYPDLSDFGGFNGFNKMVGLDFRFNFWDDSNFMFAGGSYLNLRYTYYAPNFSSRHDFVRGNMHTITLGWGGFGKTIKRIF